MCSDVESVGGAKRAATWKALIFCGGGVYPHYYIIEYNIPQAVVLADFNIICF